MLSSAAMIAVATITSISVASGHDGAIVSGGFGAVITILNLAILRVVQKSSRRKNFHGK